MTSLKHMLQVFALPSVPCYSMINLHTQLAIQHDTIFDTTTTASYDNNLCHDICSYRHFRFP